MTGYAQLQKEVIGVGLCTFCGTCSAVCPKGLIVMNYDKEEPEQTEQRCSARCQLCFQTCPGKDIPVPQIERMLFGRERTKDEILGVSREVLKAHAVDDRVRVGGASGGLVSALFIYALENDIIDGAIVADMDPEVPWKVVPKVAITKEEIIEAAQSKENVVPMNAALKEAMAKGIKRLGVVALPCHVHGIRKMQLIGAPKALINSIKFVIGLFTGGNCSVRSTAHLVEEFCGVPLDNLARIKWRYGPYPGQFTVWTKDGRQISFPSVVRHAGTLPYLRDRCTMCLDFGELSDITVGDYIRDEMKRGVPGESCCIVRNDIGKKLMEDARAAKYIDFEPTQKEALMSGGFEFKHHGYPFQWLERRRHGWAVPDYHLPVNYQKPQWRPLALKWGGISGWEGLENTKKSGAKGG